MIYSILCAFIIMLLSSCATKISNFEEYKKTPLLELERMPTKEQLEITVPRVIVLSEQSTAELVQKSNAEKIVRSSLVSTLQTEKFADIIERGIGKDIAKEVAIAEMEGKSMNIKSVDYIIKVTIDDVTFSSGEFQTPPSPNNPRPKSGYRYTAGASGLLTIYENPTMKVLKAIPLQGQATKDEESSSPVGMIRIGKFQMGSEAKTYDAQLIHNAINNAVHLSMPEVKRFLKKKAYILEKRTLKNKEIYAINRGSQHGIKSQDKLLVSRSLYELNPLTGKEEATEQKICTGVVAHNTLAGTRAWVVFKPECSGKLRLGDEAVVQY